MSPVKTAKSAVYIQLQMQQILYYSVLKTLKYKLKIKMANQQKAIPKNQNSEQIIRLNQEDSFHLESSIQKIQRHQQNKQISLAVLIRKSIHEV